MRIVHVINNLEAYGGAQRFVVEISKCMNGDYVSIVILNRKRGDRFNEATLCGFEVISLWPLSLESYYRAFCRIWNSDLIHVHLFPCFYLMAIAPGKKVFTEHNTWNRRRTLPWLRWVERIVYRQYDAIVSISDETQQALHEWVGDLADRSKVVYNGVNIRRFNGRIRNLPGNFIKIAMIARFAKQKDQDTIVRAINLLPSNFAVSFAGSGERIHEVKQLATRLRVMDRVIFEGDVDNIPAYLSSVDLYVQSSHWEGFGLAAVEAMACGIPVLGSNVPGLCMVISDERLLFERENESELTNKINGICGDPLLYRTLSQNALTQAQKFDITVTVEEYKKIYEILVNQLSV